MEPIGKTLSEKRIEKGLTIEDVSDNIKIRRKYLEAIESGNYSEIPDKVYTKSFLKIYAEYLGLDHVYLLKRYMDEVSQEETVSIPTKSSGMTRERNYLGTRGYNYRNFLTFVSAVLVLVFIVWLTFALVQKNREKIALAPPINNQETLIDQNSDNNLAINAEPPSQENSNEANNTNSDLPIPLEEIEIPEPEPAINLAKLQVEFTTSKRVWVSYNADETTRESFTMLPNETRTFEAEQRILFQIGDAGGLRILINQFDLGVLGKLGEVMDLEVILSPGQSIKVNVIKDGKVFETKTFTG